MSQRTAAGPARQDLREYAGQYRPLRRNYTRLVAVFDLDDVVKLEAPGNGYLILRAHSGDSARFERIGRDLFQKVDGDAGLAFLRGPDGKVARVVGALSADRVRFDQTALWFRSWLLAGLVAMTAVLWKAWWRRRTAARRARFGKQAAKIHVPRAEQWLTVTAAFWIAFYVAAATWQALYGFGDAFQGYPQPVLKLGSLQCGHRRRPVIACS